MKPDEQRVNKFKVTLSCRETKENELRWPSFGNPPCTRFSQVFPRALHEFHKFNCLPLFCDKLHARSTTGISWAYSIDYIFLFQSI